MANFSKIKTLAKEKNIQLKTLCNEVGMTPAGLSLLMSNNQSRTDTIEKIAHVLGCPVGYFFDEEPSKVQMSPEVLAIIQQKDELLRQKDELIAQKDALIAALMKI